MNELLKKDCLKRYAYIIGHLKGVQKMMEDDIYCMDIFNQNQAVIKALKKINIHILENHMETCVSRAVLSGSQLQKKKVFKELIDIFNCKNKN